MSGGGKTLFKGLPEVVVAVFFFWFEYIKGEFSWPIKMTDNNVFQIGRVFWFSGIYKTVYFV